MTIIFTWIQEWESGLKTKLRVIFNLTSMIFSPGPHHSSAVCEWYVYIFHYLITCVVHSNHAALERIDSARMAGNVLIENLKSVVPELISQVSTLYLDLQNLTALCLNISTTNCDFSSLTIKVNVNYTEVSSFSIMI